MIAAAQTEEIEGDVVEDTEPATEVLGVAAVPCGEFGGVASGEDGGEVICYAAAGGLGELGGVFCDLGKPGEGLFMGEPIAIAAIAPIREVLKVDIAGVEMAVEEGLDFGEGVEPLEDKGAGLGVEEATVEFVANFAGEAGDFTVSSHG